MLGAPGKGIIVKLQACSKVITLTALGFTLSAAGAFYSLNEAQRTLDNDYYNQLQANLSTVGSDLSHYVQRINSDYYQLINLSLANVLALGQPYYDKDPLLSFFEHNFRHPSAYNKGENLLYALEALNYFKVPYVSYNFATKELKVHGAQDGRHEKRILNARAQDGTKLSELITNKTTLSQSFSVFYFGGDTYLCFKIYDEQTKSNYFVIDSYLSVLNNTAVNVKKIFSDIDLVMQGILKDDNVMIVRRGQPIFTTKDFKLELNLNSLRKLVGIHIVDKQGNIIKDAHEIKAGQEAYILGTSYLNSINAYLVMQRPFDTYKQDHALINWSKFGLIFLSLFFLTLVVLNVYRSRLAEQDKKQRLAKLVEKMRTFSLQDLQELLQEAKTALIEHQAKQDKSSDELNTTQAQKSTPNKEDKDEAPTKASNEGAKGKEESNEHELSLEENSELTVLSPEDLEFIENYMIDKVLAGSGFSKESLSGSLAAQSLRLGGALDNNYHQSLGELKDNLRNEFKNHINVYRMEGKFMAARSMLLSALPSEEAMPSSNFVDFAACTVPARELSGNFYTIKRLKAGNLAFVIGDCASFGVKAAYTVTVVNTLLEEALKQELAPHEILSFINERLCSLTKIASVSLFVGIVSETTGNIIASNAGHCSPILIDKDQQPHFICDYNELRLGQNKDLSFELTKCKLSCEDMILLYTNGVLNVKNNEDDSFGLKRLLEHCKQGSLLRADELVINVLNDIKLHKGKRPFREDVSLICLKQLQLGH